MEKLKKFLKTEDGVTAIEYGLIAGGIALVIFAIVFAIGTQLNTKFGTISTSLGS